MAKNSNLAIIRNTKHIGAILNHTISKDIYLLFFFKCSIVFLQMPISINFWPKTVTLLYKTHCYINFHFSDLLAAASIISAAISFRRWSRWSANISSGQCSSRIKLCRASSFHSMSSDVAQPFLTISNQICHIQREITFYIMLESYNVLPSSM